jgi:hypothetical protein
MAAALLAQGLQVRIIDVAADRAQESRAIGIQARTLKVFEMMGISNEFLELGHRLHGATLDLQFAGKIFDLHFLLRDPHAESTLSEDDAHVFGPPDGLLAFFPLGRGRYRLIADNPPELRNAKEPALDEWQSIAGRRSSVPMKLSDLVVTSHFDA